jgi:hypothetical protein
MFFDGEYRRIGDVDPAPLAAAVAALGEEAWFEQVGRQEAFPAHRKTQTIPLIYDPDMRHTDQTVWPRFDAMQDVLAPAMRAIEAYFGAGYFVRVILTRLGAGETIGSHRDHGPSLARAHRMHLAIETNPQAEFGIAGHIRHLPPGEIWEINNRKVHGVRNQGDAARIHLILDYVVPGEEVDDPDGLLVA